jgi:hypothetical protein
VPAWVAWVRLLLIHPLLIGWAWFVRKRWYLGNARVVQQSDKWLHKCCMRCAKLISFAVNRFYGCWKSATFISW